MSSEHILLLEVDSWLYCLRSGLLDDVDLVLTVSCLFIREVDLFLGWALWPLYSGGALIRQMILIFEGLFAWREGVTSPKLIYC